MFKKISKFICIIILACLQLGCNDEKKEEHAEQPRHNNYDSGDNNDDCGFNDDTYSAEVEYYNPKTDFSNTYTLDVVVNDCNVVEIDFPKGGWLDEDHIDATPIDDDGNAKVEDDQGRIFEVHIEKIDSEDDRPDDQ